MYGHFVGTNTIGRNNTLTVRQCYTVMIMVSQERAIYLLKRHGFIVKGQMWKLIEQETDSLRRTRYVDFVCKAGKYKTRGGSNIKRTGVPVGNFKKNPSPVIFSGGFNTLKGTAKAPVVNLLRLSILRGNTTAF